MFYEKRPDKALRFGDVVRGFLASTPTLSEPLVDGANLGCQLEIEVVPYCAIMSPCCSIGGKLVCLAPLKQIRGAFYSNPHLTSDLTNVNRRMAPEHAVPPAAWEKMSPDERRKREAEGYTYAFMECFVYAEHDLLRPYTVRRPKRIDIETRYYMVDFRDIFKVNCSAIVSQDNAPLSAKLLQLSVLARQELRDKIAYYFNRVPEEDKAALVGS